MARRWISIQEVMDAASDIERPDFLLLYQGY